MSRVVSIKRRKVKLNGSSTWFYEVKEPDIVTIIPMLDSDTLIVERQYRPALGKYIYETPAGHIDKGETPAIAAARELEEETGYRARSLKLVVRTYHSPGSSKTVNNYFVAKGLYKGRLHRDEHEVIRVKKMKVSAALKILNGKGVHDTKTVISLLLLANKRRM